MFPSFWPLDLCSLSAAQAWLEARDEPRGPKAAALPPQLSRGVVHAAATVISSTGNHKLLLSLLTCLEEWCLQLPLSALVQVIICCCSPSSAVWGSGACSCHWHSSTGNHMLLLFLLSCLGKWCMQLPLSTLEQVIISCYSPSSPVWGSGACSCHYQL